MKIIWLVLCTFGLLSFFYKDSCSALPIKSTSENNIKKSNCSAIIGSWATYNAKKGNGKKDCIDSVCGVGTGTMEIVCENEKISGRKLLATSSANSPSKSIWADIVGTQEDENIVLSYNDNSGCLVTYTITEVSTDKLFGEFSAINCKMNDYRKYSEGDFVAVRNPIKKDD
jgi:hypothetical protein